MYFSLLVCSLSLSSTLLICCMFSRNSPRLVYCTRLLLNVIYSSVIVTICWHTLSSFCRAVSVIPRIRIGYSKLPHKYLLKGEQQPECIFCDCHLILHHIFLECSDTLPARNLLLLNNVQTLQDLWHRLISVIFCIFCRSVIFTTKFKDFYTFTFSIFLS